jgi:hypothetical protein
MEYSTFFRNSGPTLTTRFCTAAKLICERDGVRHFQTTLWRAAQRIRRCPHPIHPNIQQRGSHPLRLLRLQSLKIIPTTCLKTWERHFPEWRSPAANPEIGVPGIVFIVVH